MRKDLVPVFCQGRTVEVSLVIEARQSSKIKAYIISWREDEELDLRSHPDPRSRTRRLPE